MGIEDDDIQRVRDTADIVAVVSEYTSLKRVGRRWQGLCPFHSEKSGSFSVNQEAGLYYCFGCGAKGDVITFVREKEHLDFVGAIEKLAARAGVTLRYTDQHQGESRRRRQTLTDAMDAAVNWYHERLLAAPDAAAARSYLRSRGITGDEARRYKIGWAPDSWDELARALKVPADVFIGAGLGFKNRTGRLTDAFRGRVLFPIFDVAGNPVAFGGRILPGADGPKYKNSAESDIYAKSKTLYGLNWVKGDIVQADEAIVCEGYTDVIGFAAAGVPRAVATCGTALTEEHVRVLTGYAHRIVLAFDADAAGQNAAARFYEWEKRYDVDVAVAALPAGVDPAELAREDPAALQAAVEHAVPFLGFRLKRVLTEAALRTPEGRARAAGNALDLIREHPNELVRDQYVMEVASRTRIDPDRLRADLARPRPQPTDRTERGGRNERGRPSRGDGGGAPRRGPDRGGRPPAGGVPGGYDDPPFDESQAYLNDDGDPGPGGAWSTASPTRPDRADRRDRPGRGRATPGESVPPAELEALRLLVVRRDELLDRLHDVLFGDERAVVAFRALRDAPDVRTAIDAAADPGAGELLRRVVAEDTESEPDDVLDLLAMRAARRVLVEFAPHGDDVDPQVFATYAEVSAWVKLRIEELREGNDREEAREQLLAWLVQGNEERE